MPFEKMCEKITHVCVAVCLHTPFAVEAKGTRLQLSFRRRHWQTNLKKIKIKFEKKIFKNKMLSFGVSCGCKVSSVHKPFFFCNASLLDSLYETPTNSFYCLCLLNHK